MGKQGDIVEGILAIGFKVVPYPSASDWIRDPQTELAFAPEAALLLEELAQDLYSMLCFFPKYNDVDRMYELIRIVNDHLRHQARAA